MPSSIFCKSPHGQLIEMKEEPYASEALLQALIADHPALLPGDQISPGSPRKWLLAKREAVIASGEFLERSGWLDHLFLDQDAIPTLVEVKRSSNPECRREIMGQMIDYAAHFRSNYQPGQLQALLELECRQRPVDWVSYLTEYLEGKDDPQAFLARAEENLRFGKMRWLFVADRIPHELRRMVELLNELIPTIDVLAVEVRQYVGDGIQPVLAPVVYGQSQQIQDRKVASRVARQWDETSFLEALEATCGQDVASIAYDLKQWAIHQKLTPAYGAGSTLGSIKLQIPNVTTALLIIYTNGYIEIPFANFALPVEIKHQLHQKLQAIPGVQLPEDAVTRRPSIRLHLLQTPEAMTQFQQAFEWLIPQFQVHNKTQ